MHLIQTYAANCLSKIGLPEIYEKYFPLPSSISKYVTLQTKGGMLAKNYLYFNEVIDILLPFLTKENIQIVQLGLKDDIHIGGCISVINQTNINQAAFLVKNSLLHIGVDSVFIHIASGYDKKIVALYSISPPSICGPYWGNKNNQILLEPEFINRKYSFDPNESPSPINTIKPELIASSILKLLNIPFNYPYETLYIGQNYQQKVVESVPDVPINISNLGINNMIMRMDLVFNEDVLVKQLSHCDCSIVTDKPINPNILQQFKPRIKEFVYIITPEYKIDFVDILQKIGLNYVLISYLPSEQLNNIKIDFLDYKLINPQPNRKSIQEIDELKNQDAAKLFYKSRKFILSNAKIYPCESAWRQNLPINSFNSEIQPIINDEYFLKELNNFIVLKNEIDKPTRVL